MQDIKIAAVQMQALAGKTSENLKKMELFVKQARNKEVELIVFPELSIHGYAPELAEELAEPLTGESCAKLREISKENEIIILAGLMERSKSKPYISQVVIYPDGNTDVYRKTHLGVTETRYFASGQVIKCFTSKKMTFGIQLCFDCHFPEVTTILALQNAEAVFAPHATPMPLPDRKQSWLKYLPARAYDNSLYFITCNFTGENGRGSTYYGGCAVFDPLGNVIAETEDERESMLVTTLCKDKIDAIRKNNTDLMRNRFYLKSRRPEIYKKIVEEEELCP